MARSLWFFNLLLALLTLALLGAFVNSLFDRPSSLVPRPSSLVDQRGSAQAPEAEKPPFPRKTALPPLADFDVILKQDPFRNPFAEAVTPPPVAKPAPLLTLLGIIFVGEERKAILKDGHRAEIYTLGQTVGGGTLLKIEADRVVIQRGKILTEVLLKASIQPVTPPVAPAVGSALAPPPPPEEEEEEEGERPPKEREGRLHPLQERLQQRSQVQWEKRLR